MDLTYYGLSCFQIKTEKNSILVDPFDTKDVGLPLGKFNIDMVVFTSKTFEKNKAVAGCISSTDRRKEAKLEIVTISEPGEYEVGGIFVRSFANPNFHIISIEDVNICYLGMLGNKAGSADFSELGNVDYLIIPVGDGGIYADWKAVEKMIKDIDPSVVIPCCYKLRGMTDKYAKLKT